MTGPGIERQLLVTGGPRRQLVIVSLPFYRIARVVLAEPVLSVLAQNADVVIVAPFADEAGFQRDLARPGFGFVRWHERRLSRYRRILFAVSEIMRRHGYWRRFRNYNTAYYLHNEFRVFGNDGRDGSLGIGLRVIYRLLGMLGQWSGAWKLVERLLGTEWSALPALERRASQYDGVTLVQSANWGTQDRALAALGRRYGWKAVLVPYTTDQLDMNGYLLNDFAAVCVQGPYELELAKRIHGLDDSRIVRLGSAWFRHLDVARAADAGAQVKDECGFLLYGGVSSLYFPRQSEIEAVLAIASHLKAKHPALRLVYRPIELDPMRKAEIYAQFEGMQGVELKWPSDAQIAMEGYSEVPLEESVRALVRDLRGCRLLVMSNSTSLALDVAYVARCGVVANRADPLGVLEQRRTDLVRTPAILPGLTIVHSLPDLLAAVDRFLDDPQEGAEQAKRLTAPWDFPESDFREHLQRAVMGTALDAVENS